MFVYIDESGNTGVNLFDPSQPVFYAGALMTTVDFDAECGPAVRELCAQVGLANLHAADIGADGIERVGRGLRRLLVDFGARFYICRVVKKDLAVFKFFDTVFDPGENAAVPHHTYSLRPLRLLLAIKVAYLLDEPLVRRFWSALLSSQRQEAELDAVLREVRSRAVHLPDARSRQLVSDALSWAISNPEAITSHSYSKELRYGHLPNMAAFPELLAGIDAQSKAWGLPVEQIKHDRQDQFGLALTRWHDIFAKASAEPLYLPFDGKIVFQRVPGSDFLVASDPTPGLDVIDVGLWLVKRTDEGTQFAGGCERLKRYVLANSLFYHLSLAAIEHTIVQDVGRLPEPSPEALERAHDLIQKTERLRFERMRDESKLLNTDDD